MGERSFERKVVEYKRYCNDVISREEARERIAEDWGSVVQVASMQLAREKQDDVSDEELTEMFEEENDDE